MEAPLTQDLMVLGLCIPLVAVALMIFALIRFALKVSKEWSSSFLLFPQFQNFLASKDCGHTRLHGIWCGGGRPRSAWLSGLSPCPLRERCVQEYIGEEGFWGIFIAIGIVGLRFAILFIFQWQ
eukprot:g21250.t1